MKTELSAMGIDAKSLALGCFADQSCARVREAQWLAARFRTVAEFQFAAEDARPVLQMLDMIQITLDGQIARAENDPRGTVGLLGARDQIFRGLMVTLEQGTIRPLQDERVAWLVTSSLRLRVIQNDLDAAIRLSRIIETAGWPSAASWGLADRNAGWMIVQHADRTPILQVAALRALEDGGHRADFPVGQYALLYDRVNLALSGRQRYGTQIRCVDGRSVPDGLELPAEVDIRRRTEGLGPLPEYMELVGDVCISGK